MTIVCSRINHREKSSRVILFLNERHILVQPNPAPRPKQATRRASARNASERAHLLLAQPFLRHYRRSRGTFRILLAIAPFNDL